jgi:hypothetical protein
VKIERSSCAGVEQINIYPFGRPRRSESEDGSELELPHIHVCKWLDGRVEISWQGSDQYDYRDKSIKNAELFAKCFAAAVKESKRPILLNGLSLKPVGFMSINRGQNYKVNDTEYTKKHLKKYIGWVGRCKLARSLTGALLKFHDNTSKFVPFESISSL